MMDMEADMAMAAEYLGYTAFEIAIIMFTFFFAAFVKGLAGLGFTTICLAVLAYTVGLKKGIPLIVIPGLISDLILVYEAGHFRESFSRFWRIYLYAVPGVVIGLWFLGWASTHWLTILLGFIIVAFVGYALLSKNLKLKTHWEKAGSSLSGFSTGLLTGMTGSQLMPITPFLVSLDLPRSHFIQTINSFFTVVTVMMILGLTYMGLLHLGAFAISITGLVFVYIGTKSGNYLGRRFSPILFRYCVLVMMLFSGLGLIIKEVWLNVM
ncbi:Sulfite exporter TauE/SafE [Pseudovibrio sp. W64]|uniref:sulfite exporter TauE/SafE family protein n=1 Tax=Pseudovibrio sp. W64 TaxID=1735583 RepID=UPI0007AE6064|nr:sulfite exporter TauE/SafE family protein [Pseudovibrio sp. W64]KZK89821.1 Sulfite exporter TauE/SafE [Pseudovibrio sp. W64]